MDWMVCFRRFTRFGVPPDVSVRFRTMMCTGFVHGVGFAAVKATSNTELGVLWNGVNKGGSVR